MTREITHLKAFSAALERLEKNPFSIGRLLPTPGIVDEFFNGSIGEGVEGDADAQGPWQTSYGLKPVESEIEGGEGLSVEDIDGILPGEHRGLQDQGQKTTTAPDEAELVGVQAGRKAAKSTKKAPVAKNGNKRRA